MTDRPVEAPSLFQRAIAPLDPAAFARDTFGREFLHQTGEAGRFDDLIAWSDLSDILATHRLKPPQLRLFRAGQEIASDRYFDRAGGEQRIDAGAVTALLDQGATLALSSADEMLPRLAELADTIAGALHRVANVNIYAAWRSDSGFDLHTDTQDVIVLQIAGRKRWRVHRPVREHPLFGDPAILPPADDPPVWDGVLEAGGILHIPRGWPHLVTPLDEASLHLTLGLVGPTGHDAVLWLASLARDDAALRASLPLGDDPAMAEWFAAFPDHLAGMTGADAAERFLAHWWAKQPARPRFQFPTVGALPGGELGTRSRLRLATRRRLDVRSTPDSKTAVIAGERQWQCAPAVGAALSNLSSDRDVALGDLRAGLTDHDAAELGRIMTMLALAGVVFVDSEPKG